MADYTKNYNWTSKDGLSSGEAEKVIQGTQFDAEFDDIQTAVNSKLDSSDYNVANGVAGLDASALLLPAQIPQATTTAVGGGETATDTEANTGASAGTGTTTLLTPSNLNAVLTQAAGNGITHSAGVLSISTHLTNIDALAKTDGNIIVANGTTWVAESGATARASLGLTIGTNVQAWDADLDAIAALTKGNGTMIVGNGTTWVAESGATLRTSIGVGTGDSPQFTAVNIGHATDTTISREAAGHIAVEGQTVAQHGTGQVNANYSSCDIFMSTSAPTTEGANGDIWFQY